MDRIWVVVGRVWWWGEEAEWGQVRWLERREARGEGKWWGSRRGRAARKMCVVLQHGILAREVTSRCIPFLKILVMFFGIKLSLLYLPKVRECNEN